MSAGASCMEGQTCRISLCQQRWSASAFPEEQYCVVTPSSFNAAAVNSSEYKFFLIVDSLLCPLLSRHLRASLVWIIPKLNLPCHLLSPPSPHHHRQKDPCCSYQQQTLLTIEAIIGYVKDMNISFCECIQIMHINNLHAKLYNLALIIIQNPTCDYPSILQLNQFIFTINVCC